jgi:hypothetical protein
VKIKGKEKERKGKEIVMLNQKSIHGNLSSNTLSRIKN